MVKLVDILLEAEVDTEFRVLVKEFTINPLNKDVIKEEKEKLNEAILPLIIGGFLSFPKLIQFLGKTIRLIKRLFGRKPSEDDIASKIEKEGKRLEGKYVKAIEKIIKFTGFAKKHWKDEKTGKVNAEKLEDTAEILFAVILVVAGTVAAGGALSAFKEGSTLFAAVEGGLTSVKATEIAAILGNSKIAQTLASAA
jgi:hypothetical protein